MSNEQNQFDVLISGGGLSGLLTAIGLLSEAPELSIAIVEPNVNKELNVSNIANFDDRCLALSYGSLQLLNHWQVWELLKPSAFPIKTIVTSDRGHFGKTIMRASEYQLNAMGYVAAMRNIGQCLQSRFEQLKNNAINDVVYLSETKITAIEHLQDNVCCHLSSGNSIQAKLLVVAEGGSSPTRNMLKIETHSEPYPQVAVIANVKVSTNQTTFKNLSITDEVKSGVAFERFTTSGPIAFLPISEQEYSVVWSVKPEQVSEIEQLSDQAFCQQLQQEFGFAAGEITACSKRESYPLHLTVAQQLVANRSVLVGNAAHTVHPIAGQGFNLGLRDVGGLVRTIKQASADGQDIGSYSVLNEYQKVRTEDINRITGFTDTLVRMFGLQGRLAAFVRTSGLMALQKCDTLQQWFALNFMSKKQF